VIVEHFYALEEEITLVSDRFHISIIIDFPRELKRFFFPLPHLRLVNYGYIRRVLGYLALPARNRIADFCLFSHDRQGVLPRQFIYRLADDFGKEVFVSILHLDFLYLLLHFVTFVFLELPFDLTCREGHVYLAFAVTFQTGS